MGSEDFYPEERPVRRVEVDGFWMDEAPVTAGEYRRFVRETGYVTVAERPLDPELYPDADPELLVPGSLVFRKTSGPVDLGDVRNWWEYVPGAYWKRPGGPKTSINGRDRHPVRDEGHASGRGFWRARRGLLVFRPDFGRRCSPAQHECSGSREHDRHDSADRDPHPL